MIGPVVVVDEADWRAMEAAEKSKTCGMILMPMAVPDPPEAWGVMTTTPIHATEDTGREELRLTACPQSEEQTPEPQRNVPNIKPTEPTPIT